MFPSAQADYYESASGVIAAIFTLGFAHWTSPRNCMSLCDFGEASNRHGWLTMPGYSSYERTSIRVRHHTGDLAQIPQRSPHKVMYPDQGACMGVQLGAKVFRLPLNTASAGNYLTYWSPSRRCGADSVKGAGYSGSPSKPAIWVILIHHLLYFLFSSCFSNLPLDLHNILISLLMFL